MTLAFVRAGLAPDYVEYSAGWELQQRVHEEVHRGARSDSVILLEHSPVYTAGKRTEDHERPFDGTPVIPVDRGGKLTWHGPGQLVAYPIIALRDPARVAEYVHTLEEVIISVLRTFQIEGVRVEGRSGVWLTATQDRPTRKIAAIGIRVRERVTLHGFAVNCSNDLAPFQQIVPCGITDAGVTSISAECGRTVTPAAIVSLIEAELRDNEVLLVGEGDTGSRRTQLPDQARDSLSEGALP